MESKKKSTFKQAKQADTVIAHAIGNPTMTFPAVVMFVREDGHLNLNVQFNEGARVCKEVHHLSLQQGQGLYWDWPE